jgi:nucleotide-binding universal stress UspA family protein
MKTVIIPVDFSSTSLSTAKYAIKMLAGIEAVNLVLFHAFDKASDEEEAHFQLDKLKTELKTFGSTVINLHAELNSDFPEALTRFARHAAASLIVMGLTGKSKLEQIFMTSNTLKIVDKNPCPVMVVPPNADFNSIRNVALTSDFKEVDKSTPFEPIRKVLELFQPNLHIVNVNIDHYVSLTEEFLAERNKMAEMFADFNPEFFFIGTYNFHDTINQFVQDKNIDMVITIPRSHSFIENLFKSNNTKKLVFESTVPVLAAHE